MKGVRTTSDRFDGRFGQMFCFAAALGLFVCALLALQKYRGTPVECVIGLLAAPAASTSIIVLGIVIGPARRPD